MKQRNLSGRVIAWAGLAMLVLALLPVQKQGWAQPAPQTSSPSTSSSSADSKLAANIVSKLTPSIVVVEYTLKFDKGESPQARGWRYRCPNCGNYHAESTDNLLLEERPLERVGYVLTPNTVVTGDLLIQPRFIDRIAVRQGDRSVAAKIAGYATGQKAVMIQTEQPLANAKPLSFDPSANGPYLAVNHVFDNGVWMTTVQSVSNTISSASDGRRFIATPSECLIVDKTGLPVGMTMNEELPLDTDTWKGSPLKWPSLSSEKLDSQLSQVQRIADASLVRVSLSFRSPPQNAPEMRRFSSSDDVENATELNVLGVIYDKSHVLVLSALKPQTTARLQRIQVNGNGGQAIAADFMASLKDYGALVARLKQPVEQAMILENMPVTTQRQALLLAADISVAGEQRIAYYSTCRIAGFELGRQRKIFPSIPGESDKTFAFTQEGKLLLLPIVQRFKEFGEESRWRSAQIKLVPADHLAPVLADIKAASDPHNVPLSEEEENRMAWLGVELQALDPELARANKVADETKDGASGAIVTYIYPDSPAAKSGIAMGDVLLRIEPEGFPKPLLVEMGHEGFGFEGNFPWEQLDQVPEQYFDRIPTPWPAVFNRFNTMLTEIGIGKQYTLVYARDGKILSSRLAVAESPIHYNSAARYKNDALGITVRDMTFELRRYFQRKADDPGLIVSKIEAGSKISVAGIKPFEYITHVNDQPMLTVKDFQKAVNAGGELRLNVRRMQKNRIIKVTIPAAGAPSETTSAKPDQPPTNVPAPQPSTPR